MESKLKSDGDCFEMASKIVLSNPMKMHDLVLVHGLVTHPEHGFRHCHAWVEANERLVLDYSNGNKVMMPRALYYAAGQINEQELQRYTRDEMIAQMMEQKTYGPWEEALNVPVPGVDDGAH